ncbi:4089_t:CDS:2 [Acaulospora morrowiae]|uniref:4089_t:CDS:1 n=1 Tax=Acaulospora morrowiae TaxID=94023 RepID=A0A9N9ALI2_9GLOM|nr:4089_t:CDS:2 [Acaulospora morrowiae]
MSSVESCSKRNPDGQGAEFNKYDTDPQTRGNTFYIHSKKRDAKAQY